MIACVLMFGVSISMFVEGRIIAGILCIAAVAVLYGLDIFMHNVEAYLRCFAKQNAEILKFFSKYDRTDSKQHKP